MAKPNVSTKNTGDTISATDINSIVGAFNSLYDTPNQQGVLAFQEVSIAHTNGVRDTYGGITSPISTSIGAGSDGQGHLTLTPASSYWQSLEFPAKAMKFSVYSNILTSDIPSGSVLYVYLTDASLTGTNSATYGQLMTCQFTHNGATDQDGNILPASPAGVLNSPPSVSDAGTLNGYFQMTSAISYTVNIGTGGQYSRYYFTFGFDIPASAATKTYKFKIYLSYQ